MKESPFIPGVTGELGVRSNFMFSHWKTFGQQKTDY